MSSISKKITIFEGPDGSGKTTLALEFAKQTGAQYVHFGNLPHARDGLARMYVEAMLPALLGYQDVVLDRCWLSEVPYGIAFRGGQDRLGDASRRMLERLAMRCGAVVVLCRPPWKVVHDNFMARIDDEYLEDTHQLKVVYDLYGLHRTGLPEIVFDYTEPQTITPMTVDMYRMAQHPLYVRTAGNWEAKIALVGEGFADHKDQDPFYQWPFASFSRQGCSQWLTDQLKREDVLERELLWINADQDLTVLKRLNPERVIALGKQAYARLFHYKINAAVVDHPQRHKRFNFTERYELLDYL